MPTRTVDNPRIVSREEWLAARKELLAKEKQLTRPAKRSARVLLPLGESTLTQRS